MTQVNKVAQGRPHIVDRLVDGEVEIVFNTTEGWQSLKDSQAIREAALRSKEPDLHHRRRQRRRRRRDRGAARACA